MKRVTVIWCCTCQENVNAELHIMGGKPIWQCPHCPDCRVMTHIKAPKGKLRPLGTLGDSEMRKARKWIHNYLDPLYKFGLVKRSEMYNHMSTYFKREYHTAELRDMQEARLAFNIARQYSKALLKQKFHHAKQSNNAELMDKVKRCSSKLWEVEEAAKVATETKNRKLQKTA
ncbi:hypothetical protein F7U66_10930 [Vibrio parahaemolyticus]|nr:hypothetical protein [Vibrio parahaemolyticus]